VKHVKTWDSSPLFFAVHFHTIFLLIFHPERQILPPKRISHLHIFILTSLSIGMTLEKKKNDLKKKISHRGRVGISTFRHIWVSKSISNCAQYTTLDSKIKRLSLAAFFLGNPTNLTETAYTRGTRNGKPPGPIIVIDQLEKLMHSWVQFKLFIVGGAQLCCTFY
jgi:hypothetical protein